MKIASRDVPTTEAAVLGAGVVLFVVSFLHWFGGKVCATYLGHRECSDISGGLSAWHSGFFAWGSVILGVAAAALVAVRRFTTTRIDLPAGPNVVVLGLAGLGLLFAVIKLIVGESAGGFGGSISLGRSYGLYIGLIALLVETGVAYMLFRASGEALPWKQGPRS